MRRTLAVALSICSLAVWGLAAEAAEIDISGTHSKEEIKNTCAKEGGSFYSNPHGVYGCSKNGNTVECTAKETCKGYTAEMTAPTGGQTGKQKLKDILQGSKLQNMQTAPADSTSKAGGAAVQPGAAVSQ